MIDNEITTEMFKFNLIGNYVFDMVTSGDIAQQSLSKDHAYALNLYNKMRTIIDVESAELRLWQQQCLELVDVPSARQIIWIKGMCGNEGKS